eukprot:Blabericola_migrator_1__4673@NODE_246_length_10907_cov_93_324631_g208_i0_p3_GENE_NODE_246_length_10907_cov_93_324631_g208_i0NODE_246_length_10907_cov_93_324631_g208_i0_p3_ORF_typecomplete_len326_score52_01TehB/PF03848_14/4_2e06TehB/PF03848_14/5_9e02SAM_MT/PF04445_13/0_011Methyltransf_25/PF13649_6/0_031Methyltransf_31/PF13847_6/0_028TPMT/PF05724_11/0_089Methyltransf_11/PF08241_12/0_26_NODE_246_length_10907_cov_93_324631_g208_i085239500
MKAVLDCRLDGSGPAHIPFNELLQGNRWYELPPAHEPLIVIADVQAASCENNDVESSRSRIEETFHSKGWRNVTVLMVETAQDKVAALNQLSAPLWRPNPLLKDLLTAVKSSTNGLTPENFWESPPTQPQERLVCLDLGAGLCRDVVVLCCAGIDVIAIDRREALLANGRRLAQSYGVQASALRGPDTLLEAEKTELEPDDRRGRLLTVKGTIDVPMLESIFEHTDARIKTWAGSSRISICLMSRFMRKILLPTIVNNVSCFAVHQWLLGTQHPLNDPEVLTSTAELTDLLNADWEVLLNDICLYHDNQSRQRKLSMFVGRRKMA